MCANLLDEEEEESEEAETANEEHTGNRSPMKNSSSIRTPSQSPSKQAKDFKVLTPMRCLPNADVLLAVLRKGNECAERFGSPANVKLLQAHPAYAQLLAKNNELRRIIERGAEALLDSTDALGSPMCAATKVLWTVCSCVWEAISAVVGGCARAGLRDLGGEDFQDRKEALEELKMRRPNLCNRDLPQMRELPGASGGNASRSLPFNNAVTSYPSGSVSARSPPQERPQAMGGAHVMGSQAVGQALGALTANTTLTRWDTTYKRTYRNPPEKSKQRGLGAMTLSSADPAKSPLRHQIHQQMAMYTTGQLQDMLKIAGGMMVAPPGAPLTSRV